MKSLYRRLAQRADTIICISHAQQTEWEQTLGMALPNAQIVYNPIKRIETRTKEAHEGIRLGFIGNFEERKNLPLLRPVFMNDPAYDPESDCFLCGERFFVCPVFDEGAKDVTVILPRYGGWRLRGEGEAHAGGETLTVPCSPYDLPVWFERA
jgi:hypothetical protein